MSINQGTHTIPLYEMPVPEPGQIPLDGLPHSRDWARYGKATLRVYVFQGTPRPGSLTPSDVSDIEGEDTLPEVKGILYLILCIENATMATWCFITFVVECIRTCFAIYIGWCMP